MSHQIVVTRDPAGSLWIKEMSATGTDRIYELKRGTSTDVQVTYLRHALETLVPAGEGQ